MWKSSIKIWAAIILSLSYALNANATDMSVFGLKLGEPLNLPACEARAVGIRTELPTPCYTANSKTEFIPGTAQIANGRVLIEFPHDQQPSLATGIGIVATILDAKLEGVEFDTGGVRYQDIVLRKLTEKYGKPTAITSDKIQNRMGAVFDKKLATWKFPDLEVFFIGVLHKLDTGRVYIDTNKGKEYRARKRKTENQDKRPL